MGSEETIARFEGGDTTRDRTVAIARGVLGCIPIVGSIVSEVVGQIIPQQRTERLESFVRLLGERIEALGTGDVDPQLRSPENIDLFEEGALQSARALSEERRAQIASIVARGISGTDAIQSQAKRLLCLLRELDDAEIVVLAARLSRHFHDEEFFARHSAILEPVEAHMQSSREEHDAEALQQAAEAHLVRLGLLKPRFERPRRGELPQFDERTGMVKASGTELTTLGRLLLRSIDVAGPDDF